MYNPSVVKTKIEDIYTILLKVFSLAEEQSISTNEAAKQLAMERMRSVAHIKQLFK